MRFRNVRLTPSADRDLEEIRTYTFHHHGPKTADAYVALIGRAFKDLQQDFIRPGSKDRSDLVDGMRSYHITLSRQRSEPKIQSPRHIVFYFSQEIDTLVISRVLHDARNFQRHMVDERDRALKLACTQERSRSGKNRER